MLTAHGCLHLLTANKQQRFSFFHLLNVMNAQLKAAFGRDFAGRRFGPRPLDLDIIFYSNQDIQHDRLSIPHPRWQERDFVKAPLADLFAPEENIGNGPCRGLAERLEDVRKLWQVGDGKYVEQDLSAWLRALSKAYCLVQNLGKGSVRSERIINMRPNDSSSIPCPAHSTVGVIGQIPVCCYASPCNVT